MVPECLVTQSLSKGPPLDFFIVINSSDYLIIILGGVITGQVRLGQVHRTTILFLPILFRWLSISVRALNGNLVYKKILKWVGLDFVSDSKQNLTLTMYVGMTNLFTIICFMMRFFCISCKHFQHLVLIVWIYFKIRFGSFISKFYYLSFVNKIKVISLFWINNNRFEDCLGI